MADTLTDQATREIRASLGVLYDGQSIGRMRTAFEVAERALDRLAAEYVRLTDENKLLRECDCVSAVVSSTSCHKCGRRAVISQEVWLGIVKNANRVHEAEGRCVQLTEQLAEWQKSRDEWSALAQKIGVERDAAEAENTRLREWVAAVVMMAEADAIDEEAIEGIVLSGRAALAGEDTAT